MATTSPEDLLREGRAAVEAASTSPTSSRPRASPWSAARRRSCSRCARSARCRRRSAGRPASGSTPCGASSRRWPTSGARRSSARRWRPAWPTTASTSRCRRRSSRTAACTSLTQTRREIENVFLGLGYRIAEGPEVETEWHNFTALNFAEDHPAKAETDTLWMRPGVLLRTHTSPVQVREMAANRRRST